MTQTVSIKQTVSPVISATASSQTSVVFKDIATLLLLTLALPLNASLVLVALIFDRFSRLINAGHQSLEASQAAASSVKTVLISGGKMTKALQLARSFHSAGHRVVLIETHKYWLVGHRYSKAVDKFYTVPNPNEPTYAQALLDIVKREKVDTYVPVCSPVASYFDSQAIALLSPHCEVIHTSPERIQQLDDKYQFSQAARQLNLSVPKSYKVTNPQQVIDFDFSQESRPYILKSIPYDAVRRLDLTKLPCKTQEATKTFVKSLPISEKTPWIMQEFIEGTEYCTHGTLRNGALRVHCCCESSPFQVNYQHVEKPAIEDWVRTFAAGLLLTGQASFDFIEAKETGQVYAIECNPRTHSAITMFYTQPHELAQAYLTDEALSAPVKPAKKSRPTYWIYHEIWRLLTHLTSPKETMQRLKIIASGKDAIFDWHDPLPFLMVHHWQIPLLLLKDLKVRKGWIRIDFNIGKLVQVGGD